jgi:hypothetical protein
MASVGPVFAKWYQFCQAIEKKQGKLSPPIDVPNSAECLAKVRESLEHDRIDQEKNADLYQVHWILLVAGFENLQHRLSIISACRLRCPDDFAWLFAGGLESPPAFLVGPTSDVCATRINRLRAIIQWARHRAVKSRKLDMYPFTPTVFQTNFQLLTGDSSLAEIIVTVKKPPKFDPGNWKSWMTQFAIYVGCFLAADRKTPLSYVLREECQADIMFSSDASATLSEAERSLISAAELSGSQFELDAAAVHMFFKSQLAGSEAALLLSPMDGFEDGRREYIALFEHYQGPLHHQLLLRLRHVIEQRDALFRNRTDLSSSSDKFVTLMDLCLSLLVESGKVESPKADAARIAIISFVDDLSAPMKEAVLLSLVDAAFSSKFNDFVLRFNSVLPGFVARPCFEDEGPNQVTLLLPPVGEHSEATSEIRSNVSLSSDRFLTWMHKCHDSLRQTGFIGLLSSAEVTIRLVSFKRELSPSMQQAVIHCLFNATMEAKMRSCVASFKHVLDCLDEYKRSSSTPPTNSAFSDLPRTADRRTVRPWGQPPSVWADSVVSDKSAVLACKNSGANQDHKWHQLHPNVNPPPHSEMNQTPHARAVGPSLLHGPRFSPHRGVFDSVSGSEGPSHGRFVSGDLNPPASSRGDAGFPRSQQRQNWTSGPVRDFVRSSNQFQRRDKRDPSHSLNATLLPTRARLVDTGPPDVHRSRSYHLAFRDRRRESQTPQQGGNDHLYFRRVSHKRAKTSDFSHRRDA